jgi:hypothetical protein
MTTKDKPAARSRVIAAAKDQICYVVTATEWEMRSVIAWRISECSAPVPILPGYVPQGASILLNHANGTHELLGTGEVFGVVSIDAVLTVQTRLRAARAVSLLRANPIPETAHVR